MTVRGLVKRFGPTTAVDGLDLELQAASVLALLGPNGAGKTTTVEICTGLRAADAGEVRVLGTNPKGAPDALRARIGVMPQGGGAYPGVRADEMLRLVAACSAHPLEPGWLLDVLGLAGCARTPYKRMSGGQQQRLALACAVVGRPELVFLDEPTAGLDPQARRLVWELVGALRRDGVAVLLTTHDLDAVEGIADRIGILAGGRLLVDEPLEQLRGRFRRLLLPPGREASVAALRPLRQQPRPWGVEVVVDAWSDAAAATVNTDARPMSLEEIFAALHPAVEEA